MIKKLEEVESKLQEESRRQAELQLQIEALKKENESLKTSSSVKQSSLSPSRPEMVLRTDNFSKMKVCGDEMVDFSETNKKNIGR